MKNEKLKIVLIKCLAFLITYLLLVISSYAQDGNAGINEANSKVRSYFSSGTNLMYAVGAIVGLIGAVKVFQKWNAGDHDTGKVAAAWFGSCVFLVVVATVIRSFFGVLMASIYHINKGINKPIEFKGLKAQYIWYLGGGLVALLILFAIIYIAGINMFICLGVIISSWNWFIYVRI